MCKQKILIYAPSIKFNGTSGDSVHTREVALNLAKIGYEVAVISLLEDNKHMYYPGIICKPIKFCKTFFPPLYGLLLGLVMLKKWKPHILYKRAGQGWGTDYVLFKLHKGMKVTEVNEILSEDLELITKKEREEKISISKFLRVLYRQIIRKLTVFSWEFSIKHSDRVICLTAAIREYLKDNYQINPQKLINIPAGVNVELFKPIDNITAKKELGLNLKYQYVCFVGNLVPWQGVEFLIESAPLILKENENVYFLVVGKGSMEENYISLARQTGVIDKFMFVGRVEYEKVPLYVNASDVCIVYRKPMKSGIPPMKLYEYMACGKPVVAAKIKGFEILDEQKAGLLVDSGNTKELAKAIIALLKDSQLSKELGKNGRKYILENNTWEKITQKIARVFDKKGFS